jgi:hypothetical protein
MADEKEYKNNYQDFEFKIKENIIRVSKEKCLTEPLFNKL